MVNTVKLDKKNNYLVNTLTGERPDRYSADEPLELVLRLEDDSILHVDNDQIIKEYGGQIVVQHDEDKYIIDDGYQEILIKAGYLVLDNYDEVQEKDRNKGLDIRSKIISRIRTSIKEVYKTAGNETEIELYDPEENFKYRINFDTVNNIVNKNQQRKANSLAFYPFLKDMDKYGTIYVSIFAEKLKKLNSHEANQKFVFADNYIKDFTKSLGAEYHYIPMPIKRRLLYWKGM